MIEIIVKKDTALPWIKTLTQDLKRNYPRAMAAGLNRTAEAMQTQAVRLIQADVGATSQKTIRRNLSVKKATTGNLEARVIARSAKKDRIPVFELAPKPRSPSKIRRGPGVTYGPARWLIPHSFVARMKSGHLGVFKRFLKKRLPIAELFGPSVAWVFGKPKIKQVMQNVAEERLEKEVDRALAHFSKK